MAQQKEPGVWVFVTVWLVSLALLAVTALGKYYHLGHYRVILSLCIAVVMTLLQLLYYMRLLYRNNTLRVAATTGWYWLALLFGLMFSDYLTRSYVPAPW